MGRKSLDQKKKESATRAHVKYMRKAYSRININVRKDTESDMWEWLESQQEGKQAYIKKLIRGDMESRKSEVGKMSKQANTEGEERKYRYVVEVGNYDGHGNYEVQKSTDNYDIALQAYASLIKRRKRCFEPKHVQERTTCEVKLSKYPYDKDNEPDYENGETIKFARLTYHTHNFLDIRTIDENYREIRDEAGTISISLDSNRHVYSLVINESILEELNEALSKVIYDRDIILCAEKILNDNRKELAKCLYPKTWVEVEEQ